MRLWVGHTTRSTNRHPNHAKSISDWKYNHNHEFFGVPMHLIIGRLRSWSTADCAFRTTPFLPFGEPAAAPRPLRNDFAPKSVADSCESGPRRHGKSACTSTIFTHALPCAYTNMSSSAERLHVHPNLTQMSASKICEHLPFLATQDEFSSALLCEADGKHTAYVELG